MVVLKLRSQRSRETREYPGARKIWPCDRESSRCAAPMRICRSVLCRCAGPVKQDVAPGVLDVELAFPRGAEESGPVGLVPDGDNSATAAAHVLVAGDSLDLKALRWW